MSRKKHKYHYIYKITNIKTNRFYIGMHSTDNLEDGYFGGGKIIKLFVKKYGKEEHIKEILEYKESRKELAERERELINNDLLKDPLCMNLVYGGEGGFISLKGCKKGAEISNSKNWKDPKFIEIMRNASSNTLKKLWKDPKYINKMKENKSFLGKHHSEEFKDKLGKGNSIKQKGKGNSQYGTCWITQENINKKIKKDELDYYKSLGWKSGRYLK